MESTLNDRRYPAEICRERGWRVGTILEGGDSDGPIGIEITAIGEQKILAKKVSHNGKPLLLDEGLWDLSYRDWCVVEDNK